MGESGEPDGLVCLRARKQDAQMKGVRRESATVGDGPGIRPRGAFRMSGVFRGCV